MANTHNDKDYIFFENVNGGDYSGLNRAMDKWGDLRFGPPLMLDPDGELDIPPRNSTLVGVYLLSEGKSINLSNLNGRKLTLEEAIKILL